MIIKRIHTTSEFLHKVEDFLLMNEVVNNLALGILFSQNYQNPFYSYVENDDGHLVFVMVMTPPFNLIIYGEGEQLPEAINMAVTYLLDENIKIPGVVGPKELATLFASTWEEKSGGIKIVSMDQRIYKLEKVNPVHSRSGHLRVATRHDLDLVADWIYDFAKVEVRPLTKDEAMRTAERFIGNGTLYLWEDNIPVSMVNKTRPTKNGIVVNCVYTPPEYRNLGYATTSVAAFSQLLLNEGYQYCSLYTDLSNPTSNSIYMKIGYQPVIDSIVYTFMNEYER